MACPDDGGDDCDDDGDDDNTDVADPDEDVIIIAGMTATRDTNTTFSMRHFHSCCDKLMNEQWQVLFVAVYSALGSPRCCCRAFNSLNWIFRYHIFTDMR